MLDDATQPALGQISAQVLAAGNTSSLAHTTACPHRSRQRNIQIDLSHRQTCTRTRSARYTTATTNTKHPHSLSNPPPPPDTAAADRTVTLPNYWWDIECFALRSRNSQPFTSAWNNGMTEINGGYITVIILFVIRIKISASSFINNLEESESNINICASDNH